MGGEKGGGEERGRVRPDRQSKLGADSGFATPLCLFVICGQSGYDDGEEVETRWTKKEVKLFVAG